MRIKAICLGILLALNCGLAAACEKPPAVEEVRPINLKKSVISGIKFFDRNRSGTQDTGEGGLAGWTITVKDSQGATVCTAVTDANGQYQCAVPPGVYTVIESPQPGWIQTYPSTVSWTVNVSGLPTSYPNKSFGNALAICRTSKCGQGVRDDFRDPFEPASPGPLLQDLLKRCPGTLSFDQPAFEKCFGTTLSCWSKSCQVSAAKLCMNIKASSPGAFNDTLELLQGATAVWGIKIVDLRAALGLSASWVPPATWNFCLDLAALPPTPDPRFPGVTNILAALQDGDLDMMIKANTAVDFVNIETTSCCCGDKQCPPLRKDLATGFKDSNGTVNAAGTNDDDWTVSHLPGGIHPAVAVTKNTAWANPLPSSQWISWNSSGATGAAAGSYTYRSCFCLNEGFTNPSLALDLMADNEILSVALNGNKIFTGPPTGSGGFGGPPLHLATASFFQPGRNCLDVEVKNWGGPAGLNLAGTVTAENGQCCNQAPPCPSCPTPNVTD